MQYHLPKAVSLYRRIACYLLLLASAHAHAVIETTVPISAELGTSIAVEAFPVNVPLSQGNVYLTEPLMRFLDAGRIAIQVKLQAYDHRPSEGFAISETGQATLSAKIGYDPIARQVLLRDPRIDDLRFDRDSDVTRDLDRRVRQEWAARVDNPLRTELPPHPFLVPFRNNIKDIAYDGENVELVIIF